MIQNTAVVHKSARIDGSVEIGNYVVIGENVTIKKGTKIGPFSVIENAVIGENCDISHSVSIGTPPQDMKYKGQKTLAIIGDNCTIREYATIHRASALEATIVGNNCYLMAYAHVAHDCTLGDEICMANCASLAGHAEVEDFAMLGGLAAVHQYTRIGKLVMVGGGAMVTRDIPPFMLASGDRARLYGLNLVGLKRRGMNDSAIKAVKHAYHMLYGTKKLFSEALKQLEKTHKKENFGNDVDHIINFIKTSKRGISSPAHRRGIRYEEAD
jgi:UDP-N-acetylglucosamine acyltransferase